MAIGSRGAGARLCRQGAPGVSVPADLVPTPALRVQTENCPLELGPAWVRGGRASAFPPQRQKAQCFMGSEICHQAEVPHSVTPVCGRVLVVAQEPVRPLPAEGALWTCVLGRCPDPFSGLVCFFDHKGKATATHQEDVEQQD